MKIDEHWWKLMKIDENWWTLMKVECFFLISRLFVGFSRPFLGSWYMSHIIWHGEPWEIKLNQTRNTGDIDVYDCSWKCKVRSIPGDTGDPYRWSTCPIHTLLKKLNSFEIWYHFCHPLRSIRPDHRGYAILKSDLWAIAMYANWAWVLRIFGEVNDFFVIPSGNQTWQWKVDHLAVIFGLKPSFIGDFPASHVWLPEGTCLSNRGWCLPRGRSLEQAKRWRTTMRSKRRWLCSARNGRIEVSEGDWSHAVQ